MENFFLKDFYDKKSMTSHNFNKAMRIVFMGTPDFAVPALKMLIESNHEVVGVYTQAPKPKGRGHQVQKSPVHLLADQEGIPVFTPSNLRDDQAQNNLKDLNADVGVVVAYGMILPQRILDTPRHGCINIHASLLPKWRGAAPIHRALMAGDTTTGVTIMKMDAGLDTGPMISQAEIAIEAHTTSQSLHESLSFLGAQLLWEVLRDYPCKTIPLPEEGVSYAHKLTKNEAFLDWSQEAVTLERYVRALNPWPGTFMRLADQDVKILEAKVIDDASGAPGSILDEKLLIACGKGALRPLKLQKPGKAPIYLKDFLNGTNISIGTRLSLGSKDA
jgi:methionyl-tRNA formyltransferase